MVESSDLLRTFEAELRQGAERIQFLLLEIESIKDSQEALAKLQEVYRLAHSIKGASGVVGLSNIGEMAHVMEDRLQNRLKIKEKPTQAETSVFLRVAEAFIAAFQAFLTGQTFDQTPILEELSTLEAAPIKSAEVSQQPSSVQQPVEQRGAAGKREEYVNVPARQLDELFRRVEEAFLIESRLSARIGDLDTNIQESTNGDLSMLWQKGLPYLLKETNRLHFVLMQFHDLVRLFRMVPMRRMRVPMQRAVRDLSATLGKPVALRFFGDEQMVDASMLDSMQDPLIHIFRNAIDHGIESAEERQEKGKTAEGNITMKASTTSGFLQIEITDDGRGIDFQKIRRQALDQNFVTSEETHSWTDADWLELMFRPNFSTAAAVTSVSGRGIGLDIVRKRIEEISGHLKVFSTPGTGTTFRILVPIAMLTPRVLHVRCGEHEAAVATSEIERVFSFRLANAVTVDGRTLVRWHQIPIQVEPLAAYLGWKSSPIATGHVLVVNVHGTKKGLLVDEIIGQIEQVAFPPPWNLRGIPYLGGVIVMGNGTLVPLIETRDLVRTSAETDALTALVMPVPEEGLGKRVTLLVVDDSPTILALHRSILRNAGYEVITAEDGASAWKTIKEQSVQLILTDIEMPRMNGLDLIRKVRHEPSSKHLPIIVVSQYGSKNDLQKAAEAGADRYIVKSAFDPQRLLETIKELLE